MSRLKTNGIVSGVHVWMSRVTCTNEACHVWRRIGRSHPIVGGVQVWKIWSCLSRINESCHAYERVMSHIWKSHVNSRSNRKAPDNISAPYSLPWMSYVTCTGWQRPIGCLKLQVIFRKRATDYRALLRKMTCKDKASYESSPPCSHVSCHQCPLKGVVME